MRFTIDDTNSYEDTRYNEETGCEEYLFDENWYEEDELVDYLKELDFVAIESAKGFVSIYDLDLHFPADFYIDDDDDDDEDDDEDDDDDDDDDE